jgi:predicted DCC family thiol-disulfide oxidoreductase YuxK
MHDIFMKSDISMRIFYDGHCPICQRNTAFLKRHDAHEKLLFSDIRSAKFRATETGIPMEQLEKQIHAILPDGSVIRGMGVIRTAGRAIGIGWLVAPTGWPVLRPLFNALYHFVAAHRKSISRFSRHL